MASSGITGPAENVAAPIAGPPLTGLIHSISPEKNAAPPAIDRWRNGITYTPEGCVLGTTVDLCTVGENDFNSPPESVTWIPYGLTITEDCSTFSGQLDAKVSRARRLLEMDSERQLGAELWDGAIASTGTLPDGDPYPNTWLADVGNVDILTEDGSVALTHGLACLDQYLLTNNGGQQGVIHATGQTVTHWTGLDLIERRDGKLYSPNNNLVIASPGYSGTSPDGAVGDDNIWAYATDMIRIYLSPIDPPSGMTSIDRRRNDAPMLATRVGLAEWQRCRHGGVRLSMQLCGIGGS